MPKILVSLVSEQAIPNVLLIRTLQDVDRYLFVSTKRMNDTGRLEALLVFCPHKQIHILSIDEMDPVAAQQDIAKEVAKYKDARFLVNLTGGTKVMSIAAYEFFRQRNAQFLYLPPKADFFSLIYPSYVREFLPVGCRLSPCEYLGAYNIGIGQEQAVIPSESVTDRMFEYYVHSRQREFPRFLADLGSPLFEISPQYRSMLDDLSQLLELDSAQLLAPQWLKFLKGGWFEAYLFHRLSRVLPLGQLRMSLRVAKNYVPNELDLVFTHRNILHVLELKTHAPVQSLTEALYKLDSVRRDYGLYPVCCLAVASSRLERSSALPLLSTRAKNMGIRLLTYGGLRPDRVDGTVRDLLSQ